MRGKKCEKKKSFWRNIYVNLFALAFFSTLFEIVIILIIKNKFWSY